MTYILEIQNVDDQAYLDIKYFVDKYLRKIDGMQDTGTGSGDSLHETEMNVFAIDRSHCASVKYC